MGVGSVLNMGGRKGPRSKVENGKTASQIAKTEASHGLQEIAISYLPSDSETKKFMKHLVGQKTQNKDETAIPRNQEIGTLCPTLHGNSPSKSLEISSDKQKNHLCTNSSTLSGNTKVLRKTERERHKTLQTKELTFEETDLIQETEENFRSVISSERYKRRLKILKIAIQKS